MIDEIHTTDLITPCKRAVQLKHEGKAIREATTALYTGLLVHKALELTHRDDRWADESLLDDAKAAVDATLKDEQRAPTVAVHSSMGEIMAEAQLLVSAYHRRFGERFASCDLLGVEVPVRFTLEVDGQPQAFASHLDLLFRDQGGALCIWDWKTGKEQVTRSYLHRNIQLGLYYLAVERGLVYLDLDGTGPEYHALQESPLVEWVHVRNLKPFGRATEDTDEDGKTITYAKGDERPDSRIVRTVLHSNPGQIVADLTMHVRAFRAGIYLPSPDPIGCHVCECRRACPSFADGDATVNQEHS